MTYRVVAAPSAENDINATIDYIMERRSIAAALHWRDDLVEKMQTLRQFPARCPIAEEESAVLGETIRLLIVKPYLVLFRVVVCERSSKRPRVAIVKMPPPFLA